MFKVTWKVEKTVQTECPDYKPDPYTGEYPMFHCAVYHSKQVTEDREKDFETKEEAEEFIKNSPARVEMSVDSLFHGRVYDFKIMTHNLSFATKKL